MNRHSYSNLDIIIEKALLNSRLELQPFNNNYYNKSLILEGDILQWILDKKKYFNNLNIVKEIVQNEIHLLKIKFKSLSLKKISIQYQNQLKFYKHVYF